MTPQLRPLGAALGARCRVRARGEPRFLLLAVLEHERGRVTIETSAEGRTQPTPPRDVAVAIDGRAGGDLGLGDPLAAANLHTVLERLPDGLQTPLGEGGRRGQRAAAAVLGVQDVRFLGYRDGELQVSHELRRDISRVIRQVRPDRMLIQSPERNWARIFSSHPDHMAAGDAAGGGGWGPVATSTLMASGRMHPRMVIGTVSASEFLVSLGLSRVGGRRQGIWEALQRRGLAMATVAASENSGGCGFWAASTAPLPRPTVPPTSVVIRGIRV